MTAIVVIATGAVAAVGLFTLAWGVGERRGNAGLVDGVWALAIGALIIYYAIIIDSSAPRRAAIAVMAGAWAARLGGYLLRRAWRHTGEDARYAALRRRWGAAARPRLLVFAWFQALTVALLSLAAWPGLAHPSDGGRDPGLWLAVMVWAVAWSGEALADRQLARFKADPVTRAGICRVGLWRWSRHPNYFCEWLYWWIYPLLGWGAPGGGWCVLAPVAMYVVLTRLSGVVATEAQSVARHGEAYRVYQRETNAFFPGPSRRRAGSGKCS